MSPEQIREKLPPPLQGPRIEADNLPRFNPLRIQAVCVCGRYLELATYMDGFTINLIVKPCPCYQKKVKK